MLQAIDQGKQPLADFALEYREQIPLEKNITVSVKGDGQVVVTVSSLKPSCAERWDDNCWQTDTVQQRMEVEKLKALVNLFAVSEAEAFPHETEPPPGAVYLAGDVSVGGVVVMSLASSMDRLDQYPALAKLRQLLSDFLR